MADTKAPFIKVDGIPEGYKQTTPVEPEKRLPASDIRIDICTPSDAETIVKPTPPSFPPSYLTHTNSPKVSTPLSRQSSGQNASPPNSAPRYTSAKPV